MTFDIEPGTPLQNVTFKNNTVSDKVPFWTPEEEADFGRRMGSLGPIKLTRRPKPPTAVTFAVDLSIDRKARATCPECRKRRVLYAIVVGGNAFGGSEPRCARCWGFR